MAGLDKLLLIGVNHLLQSEAWARDRLRPFAGALVQVAAGPLVLNLRIDERGLIQTAEKNGSPDVTITLPADTPVRFVLDPAGLLSSAKLSGPVDIAESLGFVFRNLRWDVEADLARLIGDIPARRLALFGAQFGIQLQQAAKRLAENLAEYATEDSSLLAANRDIAGFAKAVNALHDDLARLEMRISRL